ncbi:MAG TPA: SBBP repeat-containing protein, partial [Bacteroidia bacterium]|nr:SBBP repeat-containing protein [Bacteroidia bacterium]
MLNTVNKITQDVKPRLITLGEINITLLALSFLFSFQTFSQTPNWLWAKQMSGTSQDYGYSIATDASSNVYATGFFSGTVDFDPGTGTFNLTSAGMQDIFISKLDASGNFVWAKQMGGTDNDYGSSISLDAAGNVYTTGSFQGTVDFDPGPGVFNLTAAGGWDIFVSKFDGSGNFTWAKRMGGISTDRSFSIALDLAGSGDVYTTGFFMGTADFDPGAGVFNLNADATTDIFISKLDGSGNFVWAKAIGSAAGVIYSYSLALDVSGNVYTTGDFWGTIDFDPGAAVFNLTPVGFWDIFISKLDASGNFVWAKQMGGTGSGKGYSSIASDVSGNVYTTGFFYETVDFDPGVGTFNLTSASAGEYDIFISKLNGSGNFVWAKRVGGPDGDFAYSIALDAAGSVYTTGGFSGTVDFDPGTGTFNLTSAGDWEIFVSKLDGSGSFAWAKAVAGATGSDFGQSIALDA